MSLPHSASPRRLLVTGGAGFIGSNFVLHWLEEGLGSVINLDKLTYAGNLANLDRLRGDTRHVFIRGDINDAPLLEQIFREHRPEAVVHFAAETHVDRSIHVPEDFIRTNVNGTFQLLRSSLEYWQTLEKTPRDHFRFLNVSTDEVYGSLAPDDPGFHEDSPYRPSSPYAASKAAADHLARAFHLTYGLPVLTTNCSNNYGPLQFPEKLIPLMIHQAITKKPLPIYGDGKNVRDWLYVLDHCRAIAALLQSGRPGQSYGIAGESEKTNLEVVEAICSVLDQCCPRAGGGSYAQLISFVTDRPAHDRRYALNTHKIRAELGWQPCETFTGGIRKTVQWYLDNQAWVAQITTGEYRQWISQNYEQRSSSCGA